MPRQILAPNAIALEDGLAFRHNLLNLFPAFLPLSLNCGIDLDLIQVLVFLGPFGWDILIRGEVRFVVMVVVGPSCVLEWSARTRDREGIKFGDRVAFLTVVGVEGGGRGEHLRLVEDHCGAVYWAIVA